eukprot:TRINITY_DN4463_c0_g1_i2.p2 TRINITY_DN4463_c0_g1~~TRINITY_DN4463_c0_g1_i2.p2  ORF type:complete len:255 (-),score=47.52 TRINITY_DN4463_c0_g1_i2:111-875(-)
MDKLLKNGQDLADYLSAAFFSTGKTEIKSVDIISGLTMFNEELVAFNEPNLAPIVVIRELQQLEKVSDDGHIYVDSIMSYFESRKQSAYMIPVIVETSDFRWLKRTHLLESRESFKMHYVAGFNRDLLFEVLVKELERIDDITFNYLWDNIGNHPGTWYVADDMIVSGIAKEEVIRLLGDQFYNDLKQMIKNSENPSRMIEFLKYLEQMDFSVEDDKHEEEMNFFLSKNVLLYDGDYVKPQHMMWKAMIEKYLE